jgi:hypothetical protein
MSGQSAEPPVGTPQTLGKLQQHCSWLLTLNALRILSPCGVVHGDRAWLCGACTKSPTSAAMRSHVREAHTLLFPPYQHYITKKPRVYGWCELRCRTRSASQFSPWNVLARATEGPSSSERPDSAQLTAVFQLAESMNSL